MPKSQIKSQKVIKKSKSQIKSQKVKQKVKSQIKSQKVEKKFTKKESLAEIFRVICPSPQFLWPFFLQILISLTYFVFSSYIHHNVVRPKIRH